MARIMGFIINRKKHQHQPLITTRQGPFLCAGDVSTAEIATIASSIVTLAPDE